MSRAMPARTMSLRAYILHRNGVPAGAPRSLRNMLLRAFGAPTFAGFWRHWNPVFGYALGRYVYTPLQRWLPRAPALVVTFGLCGALHDLVTMAVRGAPAVFFTPWFLLLGIGVLLGRAAHLDTSARPWWARAAVNLAYVGTCLAVTILLVRHLPWG